MQIYEYNTHGSAENNASKTKDNRRQRKQNNDCTFRRIG